MPFEFQPFPKMARLKRAVVITEKIDGTNAAIRIVDSRTDHLFSEHDAEAFIAKVEVDGGYLGFLAQSRNRFLTPEKDNYGFAGWVQHNAVELAELGEGIHFGEWWGMGIQRNYGLKERRFSLFNSGRWVNLSADWLEEADGRTQAPACCHVVPVLAHQDLSDTNVDRVLDMLRKQGSVAAPGFMRPEGIVVYHTHAKTYFKRTLENDEMGKEEAARKAA